MRIGSYIGCQHTSRTTCEIVARNGHANCLRYLHTIPCGGYWHESVQKAAAINGHLECLQVIHGKGYDAEDACYFAAKNGHYDCLVFLYDIGAPFHFYPDQFIQTSEESIKCTKFIIDNRKEYSFYEPEICYFVARHGLRDLLNYLHLNNFKWNYHAAVHDQLNCLIYAHENNCPVEPLTQKQYISITSRECKQYIIDNIKGQLIKQIDKYI